MTISLRIETEPSTQNSGWRMSIMETIGTILTGEKRYQGRNGTSSGIGILENYWNKFLTSALITPNKYTIICIFVCLIIVIFTGCMQRTTCWKIVNGGKCIPIQTYEEWNKCVANCETTLGTKVQTL